MQERSEPAVIPAPPPPPSQATGALRVLLVLIALLLGTVGGLIGGILAAANGGTAPMMLGAGAVAFGGVVSLTLLVERSLGFLKE